MIESNFDLLRVKNLSLFFKSKTIKEPKLTLSDITFNIRRGEILGLIGNSGSGKSMTSYAITSLLPVGAVISSGSIEFDGTDILTLSPKERRKLLGNDIGMVFQEPLTSLDPLRKIGSTLSEILITHQPQLSDTERKARIDEILRTVGFPNPQDIHSRYPHELSGGQRQRILIAGAALLKPRLLICDEPTSALDSITTSQILNLLRDLCGKFKMSILFISHDLSIVDNFCDRVIVMNEGRIIESDTTFDVLHHPKEPFTADLLTKSRLDPKTLNLSFAPVDYSKSPILRVKNLAAGYGSKSSPDKKRIIDNISFDVFPNEVLGLIGSSGCGKTTLCKTILGLTSKLDGTIDFVKSKSIGVVFQDPGTCLNPSHTIKWHLNEPLIASGKKYTKEERESMINEAIWAVGLQAEHLKRYPSQLSGGQRQRVAIAAAIILRPALIIADEPFSALDASSGAAILSLLSKINREYKTSFLIVSHNINIIRHICPRVMVMNEGKIEEIGLTSQVFNNPESEFTKKLLKAEKFELSL